MIASITTVLNLINTTHGKKNNFNFENARFMVKVVNRSGPYIIRKMVISCVKLDHALYHCGGGVSWAWFVSVN